MTWFIVGLWIGAATGWFGCAMFASGKSDEAQLWKDRWRAEHDDHQRTIAHAEAIERRIAEGAP